MVTKHEALTHNMFHDNLCRRWRRNGQTKIWKTRDNEFRVPVKYGLYNYDAVTHLNSGTVHIPGAVGCKAPNDY